MTTIATITAAPDLEIIEGQITTTSNQVAEHFGKRHDTVLRAIRNLDCSPEYHARNFAEMVIEVEIGGGAKRKSPAYRLTRDGFVFLAMGFTGKEAAQWKEAYITAFNKMESELLAKTTRPANPAIDYTRVSPSDKQTIRKAVAARAGKNKLAYAAIYEALHRRFDVNSYHELPAESLQEALTLVNAINPTEWEVMDEPTQPQPTAFSQGLNAARDTAMHYFDAVRNGQPHARLEEIPTPVLEGIVADSLMGKRFLAGYDLRTGQMQVQLVPRDTALFSPQAGSFQELIHSIPMERLPELQNAMTQRIATHLGALRRHVEMRA